MGSLHDGPQVATVLQNPANMSPAEILAKYNIATLNEDLQKTRKALHEHSLHEQELLGQISMVQAAIQKILNPDPVIFSESITKLELTERTRGLLTSEGVQTVSELVQRLTELRKNPKFDSKTIEEVKISLTHAGLAVPDCTSKV